MQQALVLTGYGINCDYETKAALGFAGFKAKRVHINSIISGRVSLDSFQLFAFPGGFSYGDDLGAGKALANKILNAKLVSERLESAIKRFVDDGKIMIGICNGFQVMAKLGLLPALGGKYFNQEVTLTFNDSGKFEDRWVRLKVNEKSPCVFIQNIDSIDLPVRHGEGKFVALNQKILGDIEKNNLVVMRYADDANNVTDAYPLNPNGSVNSIAGICDESGRVFGLMPHPEAFLFACNHPQWARKKSGKDEGLGLQVFRNAFEFFKK